MALALFKIRKHSYPCLPNTTTIKDMTFLLASQRTVLTQKLKRCHDTMFYFWNKTTLVFPVGPHAYVPFSELDISCFVAEYLQGSVTLLWLHFSWSFLEFKFALPHHTSLVLYMINRLTHCNCLWLRHCLVGALFASPQMNVSYEKHFYFQNRWKVFPSAL